MKIIIDNEEKDLKNYSGNVLELLLEIENNINEEKKAIEEIRLNGQPLDEFNEEYICKMKLSEVESIEYDTKSYIMLVQEGIRLGEDYLAKLFNGINEIIDNLETNQPKKGFNLLSDAIEGIRWYLNNLVLMQNLIPDRLKEKYQIIELEDYLDRITEILQEIILAMQNNDIILLLDFLEYEIKPVIKNWIDLNQEMVEVINEIN